MQRHSGLGSQQSSKNNKPTQQQFTNYTTTNTTTTTAAAASTSKAAAAQTAIASQQQRQLVKVIKCKTPLHQFKFYLDICDNQLAKKIEEQIKALGGILEFFLNASVTHFITDKSVLPGAVVNCSQPGTPNSNPTTPQTPLNIENAANKQQNKRQTRADTLLNRARRQTTAAIATTTTTTSNFNLTPIKATTNSAVAAVGAAAAAAQLPYIVWQTDYAQRFLQKVQAELKRYLSSARDKQASVANAIQLKTAGGAYIKIEAKDNKQQTVFRPYYQLFRKPASEWPKIDLLRDEGAFRLTAKKPIQNMTRKSRSRSSQTQRRQANATTTTTTAATAAVVATNNKKQNVCNSAAATATATATAATAVACKNYKESSDKQCGICEICKIEYDALSIHLQTKEHEFFARNSQNFIALDTLIQNTANVNKFLLENSNNTTATTTTTAAATKCGLEEMEYDETAISATAAAAAAGTALAADELNASDPLRQTPISRCNSAVHYKTPSPTLREKSKRSTKGKHSSEKFQNTSKHQQHTAALLPATATITHAMRKKTTSAASGLSPPMRARLPNSTVYKVVETTELCTPLRKDARNAQTIASPSITIKFKKVRTAELQRLNGEAESFMFPKQQRTSSEPTDVDRQTSMEEIAQTSSYCLDSSVSSELMPMQNAAATARKSKCKNARQSFPNAPIQPKIQLKKVTTAATTTTTKTTTNTKAAANSKSNKAAQMAATLMALTLPEATRKSSRTATAIVTAATTSSRLLRAAVEAAKHNSRQQLQEQHQQHHQQQQQTEIESNEMLQPPVNAKSNTATTATTTVVLPKKLPEQRRTVARNSIVKLEDRMGEAQQQAMQATTTTRTRTTKMKTEQTMPESINNTPRTRRSTIKTPSKEANHCTPRKRARIAKYAYDDDDDFDFEAECETTADDDDDDEDFIVRERCRTYRSQSVAARSINNSYSRRGNNSNMSLSVAVRDRANRRQNRQSLIRIEQHIQTDLGKNSNNMKVKVEKMEPTIKAQEATPVVVAAASVSNKKQAARKQQRKRPSTLTAEQQSITTSQKPNEDTKTIKVAEASTTTEVSPTTSTATNSTDKPSPKRFYDYNKSEHLRKLKFAFERLPESDLWYRVYKRQDVGEEQYFAYFGSRNYRKLPYELGPIPFDSTIDAMDCCKLCQRQQEAKEGKVKSAKVQQQQQEQEQPTSSLRIKEEETKTTAAGSNSFNGFLSSSAQYAHKHKKLHLLQRYQQEQQQLLLQQKQEERLQEENAHTLAKCDSKTNLAVSLPPVNRMRADSTHSNTSSCASSSAATSINRSKPYRNKQLSRVAYLSLELPPRKSPREHASTLALVSSIKQRQDSQSSQQNSETEEPTAPMPNMLNVKEEQQQQQQQIQAEQKVELQTIATVAAELPIVAAAAAEVSAVVAVADSKDSLATVKAARSAASTPVEEVRYATAICESVKRMRRGQNKYDHSPPYVHHQPRTARVRKVPAKLGRPRKLQNIVAASQSQSPNPNPSRSQTPHSNASGRKHIGRPRTAAGNQRRKALYVRSASATTFKRRAGLTLLSVANKLPLISDEQAMPSIRKTGCKKGVLEFEIDKAALKALQVTRTYENPRRLAWEIDKYLQLACRDYDLDIDMANVNAAAAELAADDTAVVPPAAVAAVKIEASSSSCSNGIITTDINTPPPTEHFSSDFDLCDLFNAAGDAIGGATADESADGKYRNGGGLNLYNSVAERRYFNKRRSLKANRTGWPKTQRRKPAVNKQHMLRQKSRYFNGKTPMMMNGIANDLLLLEQQNEIVRLKAVITPPASELDAHKVQHKKTDIETVQTNKTEQQDEYDEDGTNTEQDAAESLPDENDADIEADEEEEEDEDDDDDDDDASMVTAAEHVYVEDEDSITMSTDISKRTRYNADATQNIDNALQVNCNTPVLSSTPNNKQQILRGLRRNNTPQHQQQQQLNGSLASCVSPCEKAGDHSDIFTVSSDGLDTDLDVSNHQQQQHNHHNHKATAATVPATVENENCTERIPKRRLDITKYAPGGAASKPCAAEAATAAAKSLAISQFLSKGVRVQCRRLPALRRIRYRR